MRALRLTGFHLTSLWNWRSLYLGRLIEPLCYVLFLLAGLRGSTGSQIADYPAFMLTGMTCLLTFRAGTMALADVANDRKWGVFTLYRHSGGRSLGYLASIMFSAALLLTAQVLMVIAAIFLVAPGQLSLGTVASSLGLGFLATVTWVTLGAAIACAVDSYARRDMIITLTALPVVLSAPLLYPAEGASEYLRQIMRFNPLTTEVGVLRAPSPGGVLALVVAAALSTAIAAGIFARQPLLAQER